MAPPVAVYVVAAVVGVAAVFAFKEYVYEPHIAPKFEAWAEDFLERRRAARNRRASAVPVRRSRRPNSSESSDLSHDHPNLPREGEEEDGALGPHGLPLDEFELEALVSREVDEWRNEVLRSQERTREGLRKRRTGPFRDDFDGFDSASTTLDESFTSLTYTPLAPTHVISNLSSPMTPSTVSLPQTPTGHRRSVSQSTTTLRDTNSGAVAPPPPSVSIPEIVVTPLITSSPGPAPCSLTNGADHPDTASPSPLAIPNGTDSSPTTDGIPHPLFVTPVNETMAEDSPFGPLLPDTPRSSAEIYGECPFSPITRVMGSSSSYVSTAGSRGTLSSRATSTSSLRTIGSSSVLRRSSGLANVVMSTSDDGSDDQNPSHVSTSTFSDASPGVGINGSVISSLSERYPAPPTPPVIVSPPTSSIGILSAPSTPGSSVSEVVVNHDAFNSSPSIPSTHTQSTFSSLPLLQLPVDASHVRPMSASTTGSSALSFASFLSPMPLSRTASESEGDEFMSVASESGDSDSEWHVSAVSPAMPGEVSMNGPVHDHAHNPFLDFEHVTSDPPGHADGSEGSDVFVGSDESWGDIGR